MSEEEEPDTDVKAHTLMIHDILLDFDFYEYVDEFEEEGVTTIEKLLELPRDLLRNVIPEDRIDEFLEKKKKYIDKLEQSTNAVCTKASSSSSIHQNEHHDRPVLVNINPNTVQNTDARAKSLFIVENVDVNKILQSSFEGNVLLNHYEKKKFLKCQHRKRLVHFVMSGILKDCDRALNHNDFIVLSNKIVDLFPTEKASVYFAPYVSKNKSPSGEQLVAKGKLLWKYHNLKRLFDEPKTTKTRSEQHVPQQALIDLTSELEESIEWLNSSEEPWSTTEIHWEKTSNYRRSKIGKGYIGRVSDIYEEWPILKTPNGYKLIRIDFKLSQFTENDNAIQYFETFFEKASQVRSFKKNEYCDMLLELLENEDLDQNSKIFSKFILLCYMIPSAARIRLGNKKFWKPSCGESIDGILAQAKIVGDFEKVKNERHAYAVSKNITVQPYVIVVGESELFIDSVYVCIDNIIYEVPSLLEAIDVCFKSCHVFNAKYPPQCEHILLLLQKGLYKFSTDWDSRIIAVDELLNDLVRLPPD